MTALDIVGEPEGGWFWLPPWATWQPWAKQGLERAARAMAVKSGPMTMRFRSCAKRFKASFDSTGTLSLNIITSIPRRSACIASEAGDRPQLNSIHQPNSLQVLHFNLASNESEFYKRSRRRL